MFNFVFVQSHFWFTRLVGVGLCRLHSIFPSETKNANFPLFWRAHRNHGQLQELQEAAVCLGGLAQCIRSAPQAVLSQVCGAQQQSVSGWWWVISPWPLTQRGYDSDSYMKEIGEVGKQKLKSKWLNRKLGILFRICWHRSWLALLVWDWKLWAGYRRTLQDHRATLPEPACFCAPPALQPVRSQIHQPEGTNPCPPLG